MAWKVEVHLEDHLDDGTVDEASLSPSTAMSTRSISPLATPKSYARRCAPPPPQPKAIRGVARTIGARSKRTRTSGSDPDTAKIRASAKHNGLPASDRGRIHQRIRNAYYTAH